MAKRKLNKVVTSNKSDSILLSLLIFYLLFKILLISLSIKYINELENCVCFLNRNPDNGRNLKKMIQIEYYFIFSIILGTIYSAIIIFFNKRIIGIEIFIAVMGILSRLLQLYLIYLTFNVSRDVTPECECSHNNLRYVLYFQVLLITISFL